MKVKISEDKRQVAIDFARYMALLCASKTQVHIALSGGSTPKVLFDELAANFQPDIDWGKVHLYWGDERCVAPSDDQSNYKMTVAHLISKIAIPETNIHRVFGEAPPAKEAMRYAKQLEVLLPCKGGLPRFDLIILGMGDDGHTASIFPHEIDLWDSAQLCEVATHPTSGQKRITLTGKIINNAAIIAFLVTGQQKAAKVKAILEQNEEYLQYPASLVSPTDGKLLWFLDNEAAQDLT